MYYDEYYETNLEMCIAIKKYYSKKEEETIEMVKMIFNMGCCKLAKSKGF